MIKVQMVSGFASPLLPLNEDQQLLKITLQREQIDFLFFFSFCMKVIVCCRMSDGYFGSSRSSWVQYLRSREGSAVCLLRAKTPRVHAGNANTHLLSLRKHNFSYWHPRIEEFPSQQCKIVVLIFKCKCKIILNNISLTFLCFGYTKQAPFPCCRLESDCLQIARRKRCIHEVKHKDKACLCYLFFFCFAISLHFDLSGVSSCS